jgi:osmoprotectant transport system permease protein
MLVIAASLAPFAIPQAQGAHPLVIGAKNFGEQYVLVELLSARLQRAGYVPVTRGDLGSTIAFGALAANELDMYVDYSGTLWTGPMHRSDLPGRAAMLAQIQQWLAQRYGITIAARLGFENAYVLAMRTDRARALHITNLNDLAAQAGHLKIGGDFEVFSRPEWHGAQRAYGLSFATQRQYQPEYLYRAVASGDVDVITAFSSDGRIAAYDLTLLADPKGALPTYDALLLLAPDRARDARLVATLKPLDGAIPLSRMQQANLLLARAQNRQTPVQAAHWLAAHLAH